MKTIILAGGFGTRLSEETYKIPKPMVKVGKYPIIFHIIKIYEYFKINNFIIATGYKKKIIENYFKKNFFKSKVICRFTGIKTNTGGRILRLKKFINNETFMVTYGDGVGNVNITELVAFHKAQGTAATLTAVQPAGRFGVLGMAPGQNLITAFQEKPDGDGAWVNGGFFVLEPSVIDLIEDDSTVWEQGPLRELAAAGRLSAYRHDGFWQPMDTLADTQKLEQLWASGNAPWKVW